MEKDNLKNGQQCAIQDVIHRALHWWNKLPDFGAKNATFDECRFKSKGGLTQIYHPDKFCTELSDSDILNIYELHGV